jgi:hypothetical protein
LDLIDCTGFLKIRSLLEPLAIHLGEGFAKKRHRFDQTTDLSREGLHLDRGQKSAAEWVGQQSGIKDRKNSETSVDFQGHGGLLTSAGTFWF